MNTMLHEKRFLATLVDAGLGLAVSLLVSILLNLLFKISFKNFDYYYSFVFFIVMFLYQTLCLVIFKNQTLGLYLMGIKLLSDDWELASIRQIILRAVAISIPVLFIVNIVYMFLYRTSSSTIFDEISSTMVVNTGDNYHVDETRIIDKIRKNKE